MNDEKFEAAMEFIGGYTTMVADLRARDTAQREALAQAVSDRSATQEELVRALTGHDEAQAALARVEAERDTAIVQMQNIRNQRDAINKRLGEAEFELHTTQADVLYILDQHRAWTGMGWEQLPVPVHAVEKIRSKVGQAKQQEARAALATQPASGEPEPIGYIHERWKNNLEGVYHFTTLVRDKHKGWETPVFLAPPAAAHGAAGEPKGWRLVPIEPLMGMMSDKDHDTRINSERTLLAMLEKAPPAAAHGDEAVRKDAARYQWLRNRIPGSAYRVEGIIYSEGGEGVDTAIDAAMRAQDDGEVQ